MNKKIACFLILIVSMTLTLSAATLEETLESLSGAAASSYVNPMVSAFGSNMNGGWFHQAPKAKLFGWDLEFGMVFMGTMFTDTDKDFDVNGDFQFTQAQAEMLAASYSASPFYDELVAQLISNDFNVRIKGPTLIGPAYDENAIPNPDGTNPTVVSVIFTGDDFTFDYNGISQTVALPGQVFELASDGQGLGGLMEDIPALPLAAPQLSIGTVAGTKLAFRYLPDTELSPEIGKLEYLGFGLQHNPAFWLPFKIPVDVALAFFTQTLKIGDIVETSGTTYGLNVSKTFGKKLLNVTPYAGFAGESSEMTFSYSYPTGVDPANNPGNLPTETKIEFTSEGKNASRITVGSSFRLAFLNLNFDYNIAKYPSATMGLMVNLGW